MLVPHLWGMAIERAAAPLVAITTAHCIPGPNWLEAIANATAAHPEHAGIGGPIDPPSGNSPCDWAVWLSRYSAYMPPVRQGIADEIPGDNAVYRRDALDRSWSGRASGFWETIVHRAMHQQSMTLAMDESIRVRSAKAGSAGEFFASRFRHGLHYGSTRPISSAGQRLLRIASAPAVAPLMLIRILRRVRAKQPRLIGRFITALPHLVFFTCGWTLGEMAGLAKRRQ